MSPARPGIPRRPPNARQLRAGSGKGIGKGVGKGSGTKKVPLERGRAAALLTGLVLFGLGFVIAAAASLAGAGGGVAYIVGLVVGFGGAAVVAVFLNRGTVPLPEAPIWSPTGLRALAEALALPVIGLMVAVYGLIGLGVAGNILVPFLTG